MMNLEQQLEAAVALVHQTGHVVRSYVESGELGTREKGARDVVTAADLASEKFLVERLRETFPDDGIVAEEGSRVQSQDGRNWHVDPLDGTINFSRGIPIWCVSLGLFCVREPALGVVYDPYRGDMYAGASGLGVTRNGEPVVASAVRSPDDAIIHLTVEFKDRADRRGLEDINVLAPRVLRTRNIGAAALALAYVSAGQLDAMVHRQANSWDFAAGAALIRAAGGVITDINGEPYTESSHSVLAAGTPELHASLLEILQAVSH